MTEGREVSESRAGWERSDLGGPAAAGHQGRGEGRACRCLTSALRMLQRTVGPGKPDEGSGMREQVRAIDLNQRGIMTGREAAKGSVEIPAGAVAAEVEGRWAGVPGQLCVAGGGVPELPWLGTLPAPP